jgi:hypothetical protein
LGGIASMPLRQPDKIEAFALHLRLDKFSESGAPLLQGVCDQV